MQTPPVHDFRESMMRLGLLRKYRGTLLATPVGRNPEPFCMVCGADVGIFLRFGLDWRHYRGDGTTAGLIELFDPGHAPTIAWRPAERRELRKL